MGVNYLNNAKSAKNDEFYTQYSFIEKEINSYLEFDPNLFSNKKILLPCDDPEWSNFTKYFSQNFQNFNIQKLISTSYANESKLYKLNYQPTLFESQDDNFDSKKTKIKGKIFSLEKDVNGDGKINIDDLKWKYLNSDGDFRNKEIVELRDEADIIITNPPFSLFREFVDWIIEGGKKFIIIGNMDAITYKQIFPLIRDNKIWLGAGLNDGRNEWYEVPANSEKFHKEENGKKYAFVKKTIWFTNIDHGRRHMPLELMSMSDVIKFVTKKPFEKFDNYDAINIEEVKHIPSDYDGVMGVPISFLNKYSPEQFELVGSNRGVNQEPTGVYGRGSYINGKETFKKLFIRHKK